MPARVQLARRDLRRRPTAPRPAAGAGTPARRPGGTTSRPSGLACAGGDLGQELRPRDADRDRQPDLLAHPRAQPRGDLRRRARDPPMPRTSRNASSIDSPSTNGDVSSKIANTALLAWCRPRTAAARRSRAGRASSRAQPPIALLTPNAFASYEAASTTPPPTATGLPRSRGSSRCSTDAKNESRSAWRIVPSAHRHEHMFASWADGRSPHAKASRGTGRVRQASNATTSASAAITEPKTSKVDCRPERARRATPARIAGTEIAA